MKKNYDVFISHASEDKQAFVEPLAIALRKRGLKVWFDKFELRAGDSLRDSIENGLVKSRFGIVVFSSAFFKKRWPRAELNGLFAQEISGNKTKILPVLHDITISALARRFPIQSDRYCLFSSSPIEELCSSLIKVIRPKLLELETLREESIDSSEAFIQAAKEKYPGYDFSVHTNGGPRKATLSRQIGNSRIDMQIVNPEVMKSPPTISMQFIGNGAAKAQEFLRTGKPQTWNDDEFRELFVGIPFYTPSSKGATFQAGPSEDPSPRAVRVEIGTPPQISFPLMQMRIARRGLEEGELIIESAGEPLSISITTSFVEPIGFDFSLSWTFKGATAERCARAIETFDLLQANTEVRVIDILEERPPLVFLANGVIDGPSPFSRQTRELFSLCAQIEKEFNLAMKMAMNLTPEESEALSVLDCLLNNKDYGAISSKIHLTKSSGAALEGQLLAIRRQEIDALIPVNNYPGYFKIMSSKINTGLWGIRARCVLETSDQEILQFEKALEGFEIDCRVRSVGAAKLVWIENGQPRLKTTQL